VGLFISSDRTSRDDIPRFARYGDDIVVRWDAERPETDVYLDAAISLARALATRGMAAGSARTADFEAIEEAILEIERRAESLNEVKVSAETIKSAADRIGARARLIQEALDRQVMRLRDRVEDLAEDAAE
jgi:hypothetical protein